MSKSRSQKTELLGKYKELIKNSSGYILVDVAGLDTATITKFKGSLTETGANYTVIKNSVFKIALQESEQPLKVQEFDGPTAIISYSDDPTIAAKLLKKLGDDTKMSAPKAGILNGDYISAEEVIQLANIPSREVLLAKLLGSLNAPLSSLMNVANGNTRGFTMVLKQLSEK
jgi:large subunit ribosomal protein L10